VTFWLDAVIFLAKARVTLWLVAGVRQLSKVSTWHVAGDPLACSWCLLGSQQVTVWLVAVIHLALGKCPFGVIKVSFWSSDPPRESLLDCIWRGNTKCRVVSRSYGRQASLARLSLVRAQPRHPFRLAALDGCLTAA
jgi:hypothetical protein